MEAGRDRWLRAGRVGQPHGLDGSFRVLEPAPALLVAGAVLKVSHDGTDRRVERRAGTDQRPIVRLSGCADRDSAASLRGAELLAPRALAPQLEPDEWWADDLEGCAVLDGDEPVGVVRRLVPLPSCEALEVVRADGGELLVPLVRDAVRAVDVEGRRIDVDLVFLGEGGA
jgi:16S rRNA processing protein RimM